MRLWSIHPAYLDARGLVALWREALLAQAVLARRTQGYTRHPQLVRFRATVDPAAAIAGYLRGVAEEADRRGYRFDAARIADAPPPSPIAVTRGQVEYEFAHLLEKLRRRDPARYERLRAERSDIRTHPLFRAVDGDVEGWERR